MTLKRGDLALIVRNTLENACTARVIGTPVEVASVCLNDLYGFGPVWQTIRQVKCPGCGCFMDLFLEADLQRLQPPEKGDETPTQILREIEYTEARHSQHVLKAEPARADATDRESAVIAGPSVGSMGTREPADADARCLAPRRQVEFSR